MSKDKSPLLFSEQELYNTQRNLFSDAELQAAENTTAPEGPVTVLGMTFENDAARREYFREELRKKLPELRHIEGFPIGEDDDIINLSDPPYYTACPNPWLNDFVKQWEEEKVQLEAEGKRSKDFEVKEPYASDVSEGKNNPVYMAHSYHTKVPHTAIMRYILHYTQPGDIVFDGFCGTGMTGVAAGKCSYKNEIESTKGILLGKRHSICSDLSPIASFIAHNYNTKISKKNLITEAENLLNKVQEIYGDFYKTRHTNGDFGTISYVLWSEVFACNNCGEEVVFWDTAVKDISMRNDYNCPHCGVTLSKHSLEKNYSTVIDSKGNVVQRTKFIPVYIKYEYNGKKFSKTPDKYDLELLDKIKSEREQVTVTTKSYLEEGVKTNELIKTGRSEISSLYTERNLLIIDRLWKDSTNSMLRFVLTAVLLKTGSILHNVGFKSGKINLAGALPNALFIPSIFAERNIFDLFRGKLRDIIAMNPDTLSNACVQTQSATDLSNIADNSIDYIFTDPPFGKNLMYSELNSIHEAWLRVSTNNKEEAIENSCQHKSLGDYRDLMGESFLEYFRVLKPGKWMTVEFSNTSASVWNSIQYAITKAGFVVSVVRSLDKKQGSFNAQTTMTAVKQDLAISCYKPSTTMIIDEDGKEIIDVWSFVEDHLQRLPLCEEKEGQISPIRERDLRIIYDRVISFYVQNGFSVPIDAVDFQSGMKDRFVERDKMFFTTLQAIEYEDKKKTAVRFVPMGIIVSSESDGIAWLKNQLRDTSKTYQELQPEWMQAINGVRKGDILPELSQLLEENFIEEADGKWRLPNMQDDVDKEALRTKALLREFKVYVETAQKPKGKIKDARVEALRAGFKQCYVDKDFATIVMVGDRIPQNLRDEDEVLLQFYDIALNKI